MGCHVEEEKVSFFGAEDAFVDETFCKSFTNLFELISDFHDIPCFSYTVH